MRASGAAVLQRVREQMRAHAIGALIVPSSDAHNSEYVAPQLQRRAYVSNFRGSAGTAVITLERALLWTDGRYWLEASAALYSEYELMKQGKMGVPSVEEWLSAQLHTNDNDNNNNNNNSNNNHITRVGLDPYVCTIAEWERLSKTLPLHPVPDLVGAVQAELAAAAVTAGSDDASTSTTTQAATPPPQVYARPAAFCGATCAERRAAVLAEVAKQQCDATVLSALDEVAWLTNLRGGDVPYNPVFYAYALLDVADTHVRVYVDMAKVSDALREACADAVVFVPYTQLARDVHERLVVPQRRVLVDERQTSEALRRLLEGGSSSADNNDKSKSASSSSARVKRVCCGPAQTLKAIKNDVELRGFRACHVRDGAAVTRYLAWLHHRIVVQGDTTLREYDAACELERLRAQDERFVQLSFATITASGANAAMCHYSAPAHGSAFIARDALYLVDSGAQYLDGTTDVTRTICFAPLSDDNSNSNSSSNNEDSSSNGGRRGGVREEEREAYTLVLKGHIALHCTAFPRGTSGHRLDVLARHALWQAGLDYPHGTGHGVGSFLNVHEGPHGIGVRPVPTEATMACRMIVSNEPGYYRDGDFGIRIENLDEVVARATRHGGDGYLGFAHLTLVPLCRELIDVAALTPQERAWVDAYHADVAAQLTPLLERCNDTVALAYLRHHTQPLATPHTGKL